MCFFLHTLLNVCKIIKQQGYIVQHREAEPLICNDFKWSRIYKNIESHTHTHKSSLIHLD